MCSLRSPATEGDSRFQAGLEEDLGIDSVKLGEVFSVLRERYALPAELDLPRESLGTIAGITGALRHHLAAPPTETPVATAGRTAPPSGHAAGVHGER
jgi:hypothetical protein